MGSPMLSQRKLQDFNKLDCRTQNMVVQFHLYLKAWDEEYNNVNYSRLIARTSHVYVHSHTHAHEPPSSHV